MAPRSREKLLKEAIKKMSYSNHLTPRRRKHRVPQRPKCRCPDVIPPAESPSTIETCRANIKWWESVLDWLQERHGMIIQSWQKDPDDLLVLSSGPEFIIVDGTILTSPERDIVPRKKLCVPDEYPPPVDQEDIQGPWKLFRDEQEEIRTCSLDKTFFGPNFLPDIKNPSYEYMFTIREFYNAHQNSMVKHLDHLIYLENIISNVLIPQVKSKISELMRELEFLENPDLKISELLYSSDDEEEETIHYFPETERDYPEQSDEEDEDTVMMGKLSLRGPTEAVSKEVEGIDQLFYTYADSSSGMIDPEGIETLSSNLDVAHTDVRILMLAWKMGCKKQGYFTVDEWRTGMKALRADSISKLKEVFPELTQEVTRPSNFQNFYRFAFCYCLTEDKKKCIEIPVACELLNLVLGLQFRSQAEKLVNYLKYQNDYEVINMDQWMEFLRFCNEINFPSLDNYDEEQAWPYILDNFVEWLRAKKN